MAKKLDREREMYGEGLLGETLAPKRTGNMAEKFMVPPFSVVSAREGWWQDRKRAWLSLGIQSELGRGEDMTWGTGNDLDGFRHGNGMAPAVPTAPVPANDSEGDDPPDDPDDNPQPPSPPTPPEDTDPFADMAAIPIGNFKASGVVAEPPPATRPLPLPPLPVPGGNVDDLPPLPVADKVPGAALGRVQVGLSMPPLTWVAPTAPMSLRGCKRIGLDTETYDPYLSTMGCGVRRGAYIVGLSISTDDGRKAYYPVRHEGGGNMDPDLVKRWAQTELNDFDGDICGAKLDYDLDHLAEWGVTFPKATFHDIQIAEPLLNEWRFTYNMEDIAQEYLGRGKDERLLHEAARAFGYKDVKSNLWRLPAGYVAPYAMEDSAVPMDVFAKQWEKIVAQKLEDVYSVERRLIPILVAMRRRGVRVDTQRAEEAMVKLSEKRDAILSEFKRFAGQQAEFMSPDSFAHAFRDDGLTIPLTKKTKKPSITKDWLRQYAGHKYVDLLGAGRKVNTVINTFMKGHILGHQINGRIHSTFNQLKREKEGDENDTKGALGRLSSDTPNLQNIPKRDGENAKLLRGMFMPEEGETWQSDDYSQIEYRLLTNYAVGPGAEEARQKYCDDPKTDFHKYVAAMLSIAADNEEERVGVKTVNFAKAYGAAAKKIAAQLGWSVEKAMAFITKYDRELPFAQKTFDKAKEVADKQGFIRTELGRKLRFDFWEPKGFRSDDKAERNAIALPYAAAVARWGVNGIRRAWTYRALNYKLQNTAADVMKKAMVDGHEAGLTAPDALGMYLLTIHDELDNSVPQTKRGKEAARELTRVMENTIKFKIPIMVSTKSGPTWGLAA